MAEPVRVLVIDDDPRILDVVSRLLARQDAFVVTKNNSSEAMTLIEKESFDVVIVDYMMPGANGLDVLQRLRAVQPDCPGILMSGKLDVPVLIDAVNRGDVARVLAKPFRREQLAEAVEHALSVAPQREPKDSAPSEPDTEADDTTTTPFHVETDPSGWLTVRLIGLLNSSQANELRAAVQQELAQWQDRLLVLVDASRFRPCPDESLSVLRGLLHDLANHSSLSGALVGPNTVGLLQFRRIAREANVAEALKSFDEEKDAVAHLATVRQAR
ncbi:response regulator [Myxococcota bacterium]